MRFRLIETILTEGKNIEKTWQQYKDKLIELGYDDEEHARRGFDEIIGVDPTYRQGSGTTGDFGIWLLNQHCKCNLGYDDLMGVYYNDGNNSIDEVDIISILDEFTKKKPNLEKRDINQYKSIEELANVLKNTDYSDRQKLRDAQKKRRAVKDLDNNEDAELFFENDDWEVWIPHSIDVSRKLGLGTNWCTASTSDNSHYGYYKEGNGGDYFIYINKNNPSEKYQEHVESNQFHDSQNHPITNNKKKELMDNLGISFQIKKARRVGDNSVIYNQYKIDKIGMYQDNNGNTISGREVSFYENILITHPIEPIEFINMFKSPDYDELVYNESFHDEFANESTAIEIERFIIKYVTNNFDAISQIANTLPEYKQALKLEAEETIKDINEQGDLYLTYENNGKDIERDIFENWETEEQEKIMNATVADALLKGDGSTDVYDTQIALHVNENMTWLFGWDGFYFENMSKQGTSESNDKDYLSDLDKYGKWFRRQYEI